MLNIVLSAPASSELYLLLLPSHQQLVKQLLLAKLARELDSLLEFAGLPLGQTFIGDVDMFEHRRVLPRTPTQKAVHILLVHEIKLVGFGSIPIGEDATHLLEGDFAASEEALADQISLAICRSASLRLYHAHL